MACPRLTSAASAAFGRELRNSQYPRLRIGHAVQSLELERPLTLRRPNVLLPTAPPGENRRPALGQERRRQPQQLGQSRDGPGDDGRRLATERTDRCLGAHRMDGIVEPQLARRLFQENGLSAIGLYKM